MFIKFVKISSSCLINDKASATGHEEALGRIQFFFNVGFILGKFSPNQSFFMKNPVILKKFDPLRWYHPWIRQWSSQHALPWAGAAGRPRSRWSPRRGCWHRRGARRGAPAPPAGTAPPAGSHWGEERGSDARISMGIIGGLVRREGLVLKLWLCGRRLFWISVSELYEFSRSLV